MKEASSGAATATVCGGLGCAVACGLIDNEEDVTNPGDVMSTVTKENGTRGFEAKFLKRFFGRGDISNENKKDTVKAFSEVCKKALSSQDSVSITRDVLNYLDNNKGRYGERHGKLIAAASAANSSFVSGNGGRSPRKEVLCLEIDQVNSNIDEIIGKLKS